jgi:penicillin-binding protein 1A
MQQMLMGGMREPGGTSQSLWGYVGKATDTDFGGKTGTSNNHSDAWFVGVSPNLVCGAWVGGEYRSIHFRTGALGQGSRTALPICGYFLESMLADPAFKQYHGKFGKPRDNEVDYNMYNCASYYPSEHDDTLDADSLFNFLEEEIILDDEGNPVVTEPHEAQQQEGNATQQQPTGKLEDEGTEPTSNRKKKKKQPVEQTVRYDDL